MFRSIRRPIRLASTFNPHTCLSNEKFTFISIIHSLVRRFLVSPFTLLFFALNFSISISHFPILPFLFLILLLCPTIPIAHPSSIYLGVLFFISIIRQLLRAILFIHFCYGSFISFAGLLSLWTAQNWCECDTEMCQHNHRTHRNDFFCSSLFTQKRSTHNQHQNKHSTTNIASIGMCL